MPITFRAYYQHNDSSSTGTLFVLPAEQAALSAYQSQRGYFNLDRRRHPVTGEVCQVFTALDDAIQDDIERVHGIRDGQEFVVRYKVELHGKGPEMRYQGVSRADAE